MPIIGCTDNGVKALKDYSKRLGEAINEIKNNSDALKDTVDQRRGKLGPHADDILRALEAIKGAVMRGTSSAKNIEKKLRQLADAYQKIIDNNYYGNAGGSGN